MNHKQKRLINKCRLNELEELAIRCHSNEDYGSAISFYNQIISQLSKENEDPYYLEKLIRNHHCLGVIYRSQNNYHQSEIQYQKAIQLSTRRHGDNSLETIKLKNFLAGLYFVQAKFEEAQDILNSSLKVYKTALGRDHKVVALTNYALAIVKRAEFNLTPIGQFDDSLFNQAYSVLKVDISSLNMDNTRDIFLSLIHLSMQNYKQGRYKEAEELLRQSILLELNEIWPTHPIVADGFQLLADLFKSMGRPAQAERLYIQALSLRKEVLGANHLQVAASSFSLALLYQELNRLQEAEELLSECCRIRESAGFPPVYAVSLKAYAEVLKHLKREQEAEIFLDKAEQIMRNYGE